MGGYRIFQLSEMQLRRLQHFLLESGDADPLAMDKLRYKAEKKARRIDAYDAMDLHIYRDKHERRVKSQRPGHGDVPEDDGQEYFPDFVKPVRRTGRLRSSRVTTY